MIEDTLEWKVGRMEAKKVFKEHSLCRVCRGFLPPPFLDLGLQPLANNLWDIPDPIKRDLYPLALTQCPNCTLIQLTVTVDPHVLFDHYTYLTGVSKSFSDHLGKMAGSLVEELGLKPGDLHIDIGGNDGTLSLAFMKHGLHSLNIEPAANVAEVSGRNGVTTWGRYFDADCVTEIEKFHAKADIVTATNVFAHVDDPGALLEDVKRILRPEGSFVIEVPNVVTMLQQGTMDLIYHEHLSYWGLDSLIAIAEAHGFGITDATGQSVHGGSLRVRFQAGAKHWWGDATEVLCDNQPYYWNRVVYEFSRAAVTKREDIRELLFKAPKPIVGFTSPAKATVLVNYCELGGMIDYVVDDAPTKQGKYLPIAVGRGISIYSMEYLKERHAGTVVLFSWNLESELLPRLGGLVKQVLIPFPEPYLVVL